MSGTVRESGSKVKNILLLVGNKLLSLSWVQVIEEREREGGGEERGRENNGNVSAYTDIPSLSMHAQCTMVHVMST